MPRTEHKYKERGPSFILIVIILVILAVSALYFIKDISGGSKQVFKQRGVKRVTGEIDIRNAFIKVADHTGPAVVSISTERTHKFRGEPFPFGRRENPFQDEFFERFFEDFFRGMPEEYEKKQMGLGSGVIIDNRGYVLTNEHVVAGADKISVILPDGRKFEGVLKGSDTRSDLAIVKIDADNLPVAPLGDSDNVQTGEWVVAIGNPFGYIVDSPKPTVTAGVVSALHRSLPSKKSGYLNLIQTDAAINPGNSGGPLCDLQGNIIGINVAIFSTTGGYQGVGFAIPVNSVKLVIGDLIKGKSIAYGWVGVVIQDVTEDLGKYFGISDQKGVLVSKVVKGSPAHKSGLREGDVIVKFDGKSVESSKDIVVNVSRIPIGKEVEMIVVRDKKKVDLNIKIGRMPSDEELARLEGRPVEEGRDMVVKKWRGIEVTAITGDLAARLGISDKEGVIIIEVERGSPAHYANLRAGDIIRRVGNNTIKSMEDYSAAITAASGDVLIYTDRGFTIVKDE